MRFQSCKALFVTPCITNEHFPYTYNRRSANICIIKNNSVDNAKVCKINTFGKPQNFLLKALCTLTDVSAEHMSIWRHRHNTTSRLSSSLCILKLSSLC
jgi:hypothetical protein